MLHPDPFAIRDLLGDAAAVCRSIRTGAPGVALPAFTDHHVHSHLVDLAAVAAGGIAAVLDLGGNPLELYQRSGENMPRVAYSGAFLTVTGGYPLHEAWAPPGTVREIDGHAGLGVAGGVETAVDEQAEFGASVIKASLNAAAGPVFDLGALRALVKRAHERALPVVAHAEGDGMLRLALDAGVDALAHAPFTEAVDAGLIARAVDVGQIWISTLRIHGRADTRRATANVRAFRAAGGRVLYGTDLGNGEQSLGVSSREIAALTRAGVRGVALIEALVDPWPEAEAPHGVATFVEGAAPTTDDAVPDWLAGARVVPTDDLIPIES